MSDAEGASEDGAGEDASAPVTVEDANGEWPLRRLLREVLGSGPKSADDMTPAQAREAFARVLAGDPPAATWGAFLLANRWKGNTPAELAAAVDAQRELSVRVAEPSADPVDCGANYDGKTRTALLGVGAGLVAVAAGTPVVVHSADRVPADRGCTYKHVLDALGVRTDLAPAASAAMVDATGFGFYYQPRCNPLVDDLLGLREDVGVRTVLNTVETLANPAGADVHLGSFHHRGFGERVAGALRESESVDVERVVMVQGLEGYDDLRPGRPAVVEWDGGVTDGRDGDELDDRPAIDDHHAIDDRRVDVDLPDGVRDALAVDDVAEESARLTEAVLAGNRDGPVADAIAANAAVRIYADGDVETVAEGLERARDALASGEPAERLERLQAFEP